MINPKNIIPSVVRYEQIPLIAKLKCKRVNLMTGSINNLKEIVQELKKHGKIVFVHFDLIRGIGKDSDAVSYLSQNIEVNGIITTKSPIISAAKACNLLSVQRIFAIDTAALNTAIKTVKASQPDEVELMPGLMPGIIHEVKTQINKPLIVGGLIRSQEEIQNAFLNKADYVSVGDERLWI